MSRLLPLVVLAVVACVAGPLEHGNPLDARADVEQLLEMTAVPDSLFARNEEFVAQMSCRCRVPSRADTAWFVVSGLGALTSLGGGRFRPDEGIGLLPATVTIAAALRDANGPRVTKTLVILQRPTAVSLVCDPSGPPCTPLSGTGVTRTILMTVTDAGGSPVNLPFTSFRYGTAVSRDPGVVTILDRPTPSSIRVQTVGAGTTYVVLSEGSIRDSLQIVVTS